MNDTLPDWVLKEAAKRCAWHPSKTLAQLRGYLSQSASFKELCRAIEQHEAFRQEVSDAAQEATEIIEHWSGDRDGAKCLQDFIIPKPQPDPLVDVLLEMDLSSDPEEGQHDAKWLRIKLDALGFEIRKKNDD